MAIKGSLWLFLLAVVISMTESTVCAASVEKKFPTLTIGLKTYTNVTITDISGNSVFLSHSRGFESIQIESLSPEVQQQLGLKPSTSSRSQRRKVEPTATATETTAPTPGTASSHEPASREKPASPKEMLQQRIESITSQSVSTGKAIMLLALPVTGIIVMLVGAIWLIVAAFRVSPGWGIGCLFGSFVCGLINLIFICCYWHEAKRPFLCYLAGFALMFASAIVIPNFVKAQEAAARNATPVQARDQ